MTRRTIGVVLLVSLALTSVHLAEAQQPAKIPKIGFLSSGTASGSTSTFRNDVFRQQLRELGYVEGKNISFESQYGEDNFDGLTAIADELVRLKVDVLVINSTPAALAAKTSLCKDLNAANGSCWGANPPRADICCTRPH
jgi:putative tryptophan/tyrosine transport system substrate-binding protein